MYGVMPIPKARIQTQVKAIEVLMTGELKDKPQPAQVWELIRKRGFHPPAVSKVLKISGRKIATMLKEQDAAAGLSPRSVVEKAGEEAPKSEAQKAIEAESAETYDKDYMRELRERQKDARLPLIEREIEDAAWFHNLCHVVGKNVVLNLWGESELQQTKTENWTLASASILARFDGLMKYREKAGQMQRIEAHLAGYELAYGVLKDRYQRLENLYSLACAVMPEEARRKALTLLALRAAKAM